MTATSNMCPVCGYLSKIAPWTDDGGASQEICPSSDSKIFFDQLPGFVASGQLAQIAGGPPQGMLAPGQPQMQPPQMQSPQMPQDGNRYPGTLMQAANGQYLCQMPNGQGHGFPAHAVTPRA